MKTKSNAKEVPIFAKVVNYMKPIRWWLCLGVIIDIFAVISAVAAPDILGDIVQRIYDFWEMGSIGTIRNVIFPALDVLLALYALNGVASYLNMLLMNKVVSRRFTCNIRIAISEKIKHLPVSYVDQTSVGDVLRRMTDDVSEMGGYVHQLFDVSVKGVLHILLIGVAMFLEDWRLACFVLVLTPVSMYLSGKIASKSEKYFDEMFDKFGKVTEIVEESFSNYPTTKAYNLEEYTQNKHSEINDDLRTAMARANFMGSVVQPLIRLFNAVAYILINLVGGYLVVKRGIPVGSVVTIVLYARQVASPLEQLAYGFSQANRIKASAKRVFSILDMEEEPIQAGKLEQAPRGEVEFRNVYFSYKSDQPLIEDLTFRADKGQRIAIVGPTGAGKTTIVNLLMRFYDPNQGKIFLDGVDIGELSRAQVRDCFGMVLQDTWLFRGSIRENIAYGKPNATNTQIEEACKAVYCDHFIRTMPDGYDTMIGEDTTNLSGGQKQLLTIARAMLADKPLLILDEATSNVDTRTELLIQKAMDRLMKGKTCFVIAHRLSTIVDSDLILVLDQGKIVEQGTHRELIRKKGFYYELYQSQYAS